MDYNLQKNQNAEQILKHVEKIIVQNTERNYWNIFLSS